jgi:Protein of unknown function (DUF3551)
MRTIVLVTAAMAALSWTSIEARAEGPWCIYDVAGRTNCGFYSYPQCMATLSGIGGSCLRNPAYQAGSASQGNPAYQGDPAYPSSNSRDRRQGY